MLKKLLSFTLALIMIMGCLSVTAFADSNIIDEIEPNDTDETIQLIEPNVTVKGTLPAPDFESEDAFMDIDAFKFVLNERSKVVLTVTSSSKMVIPAIVNIDNTDEGYAPELDEDLEDLPEEYVIDAYLEKGTYGIVIFDMFAEEEVTYEFTLTAKNAVESLRKEDGVWKYYVGEEFAAETTLVKYSGKWFYVEDGIWNSKTTTLAKYKDKWFYIKNGKWDSKTTTLVKYSDKWFYIKNGKWDRDAKTLVKYKGTWFYVKNGKWAKETTIVKYSGKKFYVKGGKAQLSFSGKKKIGGQTYYIKNGKVV